jgi:hypothetical protein
MGTPVSRLGLCGAANLGFWLPEKTDSPLRLSFIASDAMFPGGVRNDNAIRILARSAMLQRGPVLPESLTGAAFLLEP